MAKKQKQTADLVASIESRIKAGHVVDVSSATNSVEAAQMMEDDEKDSAKRAARSKLMREDTEEGLVEYEKFAIEGLCEMLPEWYAEGGMSCLLHSLVELLRIVDQEAMTAFEAVEDDAYASAQRKAVAAKIRELYQLSRPDTMNALAFLAAEEKKVKAKN